MKGLLIGLGVLAATIALYALCLGRAGWSL